MLSIHDLTAKTTKRMIFKYFKSCENFIKYKFFFKTLKFYNLLNLVFYRSIKRQKINIKLKHKFMVKKPVYYFKNNYFYYFVYKSNNFFFFLHRFNKNNLFLLNKTYVDNLKKKIIKYLAFYFKSFKLVNVNNLNICNNLNIFLYKFINNTYVAFLLNNIQNLIFLFMHHYNFLNKYTVLNYYNQLILKITRLLSCCKELVVFNIVTNFINLLKEIVELLIIENTIVNLFPLINI
jgi:hypothetical protein